MDFFHNPYRCGPLRVGRYAVCYQNDMTVEQFIQQRQNEAFIRILILTNAMR